MLFMKLIPLTQGKFAQVDDEDYGSLMQYKWYADKKVTKNTLKIMYYARRHYILPDGSAKSIYMHRQIMNPSENKVIDHLNFDGLNNQKHNLRIVEKRENSMYQRGQLNTSSKYLGVSVYKTISRKGIIKIQWKAQGQMHKGKRKHIGYFPYTAEGEILAAKSFDEFAKIYYKEFANLNFPNK